MAKFVLILAAVCLAQASAMNVRRDAPAAAEPNQLEELQKRANEILTSINSNFNQLVGVKDNEELKKNFQGHTDQLIAQLTELGNTFKANVGETSGKLQSALGDASTKLSQTVEELRAKNPEVEVKAKEIGDKLKAGIQNAVAETDKVAKAFAENTKGINEDIAKNLKNAYDQFVSATDQVRQKVHEVANAKQ